MDVPFSGTEDPDYVGTPVLQLEADYKYDILGNRIEKTVDADGVGGGSATVSRFAYDGWNPAKPAPIGTENFDIWGDFTSGGSLTTRYLRGDNVDELLARVDGSTAYWYLHDHLQSIRKVIDNNANVKDSIVYDAFGNILSETDANYRGRYAWTGREIDVETQLQYNRARYYDATTGRWISQDPLGFDAGDSNLYRYVQNYTTAFVDPSGYEWRVHRTSTSQLAYAETTDSANDTIAGLAAKIRLEPSEFKQWLTVFSIRRPIDPIAPPALNQGDENRTIEYLTTQGSLKGRRCISFSVPNTIYAYWGGEVAGIGRSWVQWDTSIKHLKRAGFFVHQEGIGIAGLPAPKTGPEVAKTIASLTQNKQLHGLYFWGHGYQMFLRDKNGRFVKEKNGMKIDTGEGGYLTDGEFSFLRGLLGGVGINTYGNSFPTWKQLLGGANYKLGMGLVFTCFGARAFPYLGRNAITFGVGVNEVLYPIMSTGGGQIILGNMVESILTKEGLLPNRP